MSELSRRQLLATTALTVLFAATTSSSFGAVIRGTLPFETRAQPPEPAGTGPWRYFTADEATTIEALVDRLIPPDPETPGGKDVGCAVFIDRQLAGAYGSFEGLYMSGPFHAGTKEQGPQSPVTPAQQYRAALSALDRYCRSSFSNRGFSQLADDDKDKVIGGLENGEIKLDGAEGPKFFAMLLQDTQRGFLADPIYGGNKDMAGWKMIGFPGARYDYRDWVDRHNERFPLPPVSIADHPGWTR